MILSYLKLALRIAFRSPWFASVNVVGLSVGIAVFLLLWAYTQSELHSDQFVKDYERIYRVANTVDFTYDGERFVSELSVYDPYSTRELARQAPQAESFARILNQHAFSPAWIKDHGNQLFFTVSGVIQDEHFVETRVAYADPNVFGGQVLLIPWMF
jgi:putative ABC transport system permease protein